MDRLLTDISNASRLDAELVREHMEPFDLGQLLPCWARSPRPRARGAACASRPGCPTAAFIARGLEGPVAQIITNLLNNALSFSPTERHDPATGS